MVVHRKIMESIWCGGAWVKRWRVYGVVVHGKIMESVWCGGA